MQMCFYIKQKMKRNKFLVMVYEKAMGLVWRVTSFLKKKFVKTRFSYGQLNQDKVFYIITSNGVRCGLFSLVFTKVLPFLKISEKKGYLPIVDLKNTMYHPMIQDEKDYGKENPWEYYFEQPAWEYSLDEVYSSARVEICSYYKHGFRAIDWNYMMPMPAEDLVYWSKIVDKYIRPVKAISERIEDEKEKLFFKTEKIMGVSLRAGYRRQALLKQEFIKGHPKVADCEYYIDVIQKKLDEWGYDKFFLACDDREYTTKIISYFGTKCLTMNRRRRHLFMNDVPVPDDDMQEIDKEYDGVTVREKTIEYVVETYLLAACESLYSTINGSGEFAYIVNGGKYRNFEVYDEGLY